MALTRRQFMVGCSTAIAAMAGGHLGNLVFANPQDPGTMAASDEILIMIFLRGGCDGLNLVAPYDDPIYQDRRRIGQGTTLAIPDSMALRIDAQNNSYSSSSNFGLHPQASGLRELYQQSKLALIHACGLNDDTRSHFDAMDYIERGTPGNKNTSTGWLTRHLEIVGTNGLLPALAASSSLPASLLADTDAVTMTEPSSFDLAAIWRYNNTSAGTPYASISPMLSALKKFYPGTSSLDRAAQRTIETIQTLSTKNISEIPSPLPTPYPNHSFARTLYMVAQMLKADLGLRIATVDFGGWDTHESQGNDGQGYFADQIAALSGGISAFYNDIEQANLGSKITVVVMSEFGRRLGKNESQGTDHGHGNVMLVLGGNVNGGKLYGQWPGLQDLDQAQDLKITSDFRTVLSEILAVRLGNSELGTVFPGITPEVYSNTQRLGVLRGANPSSINYDSRSEAIFVPLVRR